MRQSPWWYRYRAFTIGSAFFAGFFFGPLIDGLFGRPVVLTYAALGARAGPHGYRAFLVLAVLAMLVCVALRWWGSSYLRPATVWSANALDDRLIVAGPFRFVRNPLYLGNLFLAAAVGTFATPLGFAIIVLGNLALDLAMIRVEEPLLRLRYGAAYDAYAAAVPALGWRLTPWRGSGSTEVAPSFALGARAEAFMLAPLAVTVAAAAFFW